MSDIFAIIGTVLLHSVHFFLFQALFFGVDSVLQAQWKYKAVCFKYAFCLFYSSHFSKNTLGFI